MYLSAVVFCAVLGGVSQIGHAAEPASDTAPSAEPPLKVQLDLVTESVPEAQRAEIEKLIQSELESLGQEHGFMPAAAGVADLVMHAEVSQPEGQTAVFLISATVEFEGETIASMREDVCLRCTAQEVATETLAVLPGAVEHAQQARAEAAPPPPELPAEGVETEPVVEARAAALGPVAYTGIASSVLGLGAAITGAVFLHRGEVVTSSPGAALIESLDYRPPGAALVGAGLGALVVGNVLLAVDLSVLRDRRRRARAELTGVGVTMSRTAGLSVHGRF
jgi:hypothetical protein